MKGGSAGENRASLILPGKSVGRGGAVGGDTVGAGIASTLQIERAAPIWSVGGAAPKFRGLTFKSCIKSKFRYVRSNITTFYKALKYKLKKETLRFYQVIS